MLTRLDAYPYSLFHVFQSANVVQALRQVVQCCTSTFTLLYLWLNVVTSEREHQTPKGVNVVKSCHSNASNPE